MSLIGMQRNTFPYQWFRMMACFETEAQSNSETIITSQINRSNHYEGKKCHETIRDQLERVGRKVKQALAIASVGKLTNPWFV